MPASPVIDRVTAFHFEDPDRQKVKPVDPATADYFDVFGLDTRLQLDLERVRETFLELSRHFHPDYFATADEATKQESLRRSSLINNAWKTLRDDQKRAEYVINRHGGGIESNKNAVPPELLEEMFDIQEAGEELKAARLAADAEKLEKVEARIKPLREDVSASRKKMSDKLKDEFAKFDELLESGKTVDSDEPRGKMRDIRLLLDQMNYLRTVLRNLR